MIIIATIDGRPSALLGSFFQTAVSNHAVLVAFDMVLDESDALQAAGKDALARYAACEVPLPRYVVTCDSARNLLRLEAYSTLEEAP